MRISWYIVLAISPSTSQTTGRLPWVCHAGKTVLGVCRGKSSKPSHEYFTKVSLDPTVRCYMNLSNNKCSVFKHFATMCPNEHLSGQSYCTLWCFFQVNGKGSLWCVDPEYRPNLIQALKKQHFPAAHTFCTPPASPPSASSPPRHHFLQGCSLKGDSWLFLYIS